MSALGDLEDCENDEGTHEEKRYDRFLSATRAGEGDASSEEDDEIPVGASEGKHDVVEGEEEAGGEENLYAALEEDDEFGEYVRPDSAPDEEDVLFGKVLAALEMRDGPRHAPMPSSSSEEEGLFDIHGHPELDPADSTAPARISVPPLTEAKRAAIKQVMLRFPPPKPRPGADLIVDGILQTLAGKK